MAYCKECGAYIPDGQVKCLACGFDESEAKTKNEYDGAYAYKYAEEKDSQQEEMKRRREEIREESKQWAEEELRRRKEEAEAKAAEAEAKAKNKVKSEKKDYSYKPPRQKSGTDTSKIFAALSYLSVLCFLPYILAPNDGYAKYHGKQGIILLILGSIAKALGSLFGFGWLVTLGKLYLIYKGMMNALEGRAEPLPWIGKLMDK